MIQNNSVGGGSALKWMQVSVDWDDSRATTRAGGGINRYGTCSFNVDGKMFGFWVIPTDKAYIENKTPFTQCSTFISDKNLTSWKSQALPSIGGFIEIQDVSVNENAVSMRVGVAALGATDPLYILPIYNGPTD